MTQTRSFSSSQHGRFRLGAVAALFIFIGTLALAWWIMTQPPRIERTPPPPPQPTLVDAVTVTTSQQAPELHGFGRVEAEQTAKLASRVTGQLERFAEGVVPGRVVEQSAPLAYIDQADLTLVLREPQLRQAQSQVTQARVARDQAALNVERAVLVAPWRAMVRERLLGAGSLLSQGTEVLDLVGVEQFWVRVSLPGEWIEWLETASSVTLTSRGWPEGATREGTLVSILPSLEENGLQAQLLIAVNDPLALESDGPALRLGDVVRASFTPAVQEQLISLPSAALRPGDITWRVDEDNRLRRTPVTLAFRGEDSALIRSGLESGERVVTAGLAKPREGQLVRVRQPADTSAQAGDES